MHLTDEQIAQYAEALQNSTLDSLPKEMREHVKNCDACATDVISVYSIITDKTFETPVFTLETKKAKNLIWYYLAAGIAVLAVSSIFFIKNFNPSTQIEIVETNIDTVTNTKTEIEPEIEDSIIEEPKEVEIVQPQNNMIAMNFERNDQLDQLVDRFVQGNLRGEDLNVLTPNDTIIEIFTDEEFKLEWINNSNQEISIELFDNENISISENSTAENHVKLFSPPSEGLYYWKLYNEEFDLLHCGRLTIKFK